MNNVENVISQLERQRSAIDRAILALREVTGVGPLSEITPADGNKKPQKRRLSPEGRQRIIEATKRRWATKRANSVGKKPATTAASSPSRRGVMSAAGRKRLALAMKKRWAAAKRAGKKALA